MQRMTCYSLHMYNTSQLQRPMRNSGKTQGGVLCGALHLKASLVRSVIQHPARSCSTLTHEVEDELDAAHQDDHELEHLGDIHGRHDGRGSGGTKTHNSSSTCVRCSTRRGEVDGNSQQVMKMNDSAAECPPLRVQQHGKGCARGGCGYCPSSA